jgi:signal transduction histidine kinase/CheY-like chemotaxis protein/HPt (histidine-containing phosphotransfer) domain-containing protein
MPPRPDARTANTTALQRAAPWIVRVSLAIVVAVGLGAPFVLQPQDALWISPALIVAALGGWLGWQAYASIRHPTTTATASPTPIVPRFAEAAPSSGMSEMQAEMDKLRSVQRELMQAKLDAEAAMMSKSEFLATMSHEIRTPLNGIIPLLDIVLSTKLAPDQKDYLQTAYKSARELLRIVDDILDYSKIEANKLELEVVGLNLREVVDSVHRLLEKTAEAKSLAFNVTIEPSVRLAVRGDPVRLRQVLTNLVSNAIKFTQRGSVAVHISKRSETRTHFEILFAVKDTGIGIAPEAATKLFQAFSQADASTTRMHGGTGLGLVICKRIVDLMGGKIGVRSELGRGSLFWFSVPMAKALGDVTAHRRDIHGARTLVLTGDAACMRRLGSYFAAWGVTFLQSAAAADALSKVRSTASMGESWAYDFLIVDSNALPAAGALGLVRNVLRDPALNRVQFLYLQGDESVPAELSGEPRVAVIPRQFGEGELRAAMLRLLGVSEPVAAGLIAPAAADITAASVHIETPKPAATPIGGHVLLVEDNVVNRQVAQRLLSLIGISFEIAENGKEALDAIAARAFDSVLMDCQMPVMDGYTATRIQRQNENASGKHIPIIAMTANAMAGDREKCLKAGMDDYLSKPLNRALLEQTLRKWLPAGAKSRPVAPPPAAPMAPPPAPIAPQSIGPSIITGQTPSLVLDTDVIRDLVEVMGGEFTDLVRVYLEDTPKAIATLDQAASRGAVDGLIAPSHSLKSTSANLGAMSLSELAKRIEHGARAGTLTAVEAPILVAEIKRSFQRVTHELNALLTRSAL